MGVPSDKDGSGWTVDTLREHLTQIFADHRATIQHQICDQRDAATRQVADLRAAGQQQNSDLRESVRQQADDMRKMLDERYATQTKALDAAFKAAEQAVQTALVSAEKAVTKAEAAADKRFESVNEFRKALTDQTASFMPRTEYDSAHKTLTDRLSGVNERIGALELRLTSRLDLGAGNVTGAASARSDDRAVSTYDQTDRIAQAVQNSNRVIGMRMTVNTAIAAVSAIVAIVAVVWAATHK